LPAKIVAAILLIFLLMAFGIGVRSEFLVVLGAGLFVLMLLSLFMAALLSSPKGLATSQKSSCPTPLRLKAFVDGRVSERERPLLSAHLEICERCQHIRDRLAAGQESLSRMPRRWIFVVGVVLSFLACVVGITGFGSEVDVLIVVAVVWLWLCLLVLWLIRRVFFGETARSRQKEPQPLRQSGCPAPLRLKEFVDNRVSNREQAELSAHLENCERCQQILDSLVAGKESWSRAARQLAEQPAKPEPALQRVMDQLKSDAHSQDSPEKPEPGDTVSLDFLSPSEKPEYLGRLGPYEVLQVIGKGGFGIVLKAFDPSLHRVVAIKVLAPFLATSGTARKRFIREAQAAAAVTHDHVVTIHAVDEANGLPYLVMQYIAGTSLQDRIDKGGPLELKEILRVGMQTAAGLAAAHAQGLIHRDIKPGNILLENGLHRVKITDFGLARAADDASLTQSGVVAGTPMYMAPEQARGEALDHRADLFSLGSVLYIMCTGRPPFRASTTMGVLHRVSSEMPRPIREISPEVPDWFAAIVAKLHAKEPADRFQSAHEVAELLNRHLAQLQQASWRSTPGAVAAELASAPPTNSEAQNQDAEPRSSKPLTTITICPACGSHLHVPDKMVGRVVNCPQCDKPFQVQDSSEEIQVVQAVSSPVLPLFSPKGNIALKQLKHRRASKSVAAGCLAACFFAMFVGGAVLLIYFLRTSSETKSGTVAAVVTPSVFSVEERRPPIEDNLQGETLSWFPADATFFGAIDFRELAPLTPNKELTQPLFNYLMPPQGGKFLTTDAQGNLHIDRISFAYCASARQPANSRLFVRITGQIRHEWAMAFFRSEAPGALFLEERGPEGHRVTLIYGPTMDYALAVVNETDVLMARSLRSMATKERHLEVVREALRIRMGHQSSLLQAPDGSKVAGVLKHPVSGLLAGQPPADLAKQPAVQKWFPVWPHYVFLEMTADRPLQINGVVTMAKAQDSQPFIGSGNHLIAEGFGILENEFAAANLKPESLDLLKKTLASIRLSASGSHSQFGERTDVTDFQNKVVIKGQISMPALQALEESFQQLVRSRTPRLIEP
jgi:serine/threonine protein kinase